MTKSNSRQNEYLKKTIEQQEQKSKYLDCVIEELQEELRQKQAEVAEIEDAYPPIDSGTADEGLYMTEEEIKAEFQRICRDLNKALNDTEESRIWAIAMLGEYSKDVYFYSNNDKNIRSFMNSINEKTDKVQAEMCHLMDMMKDVKSVVLYNNAYPVKKYIVR